MKLEPNWVQKEKGRSRRRLQPWEQKPGKEAVFREPGRLAGHGDSRGTLSTEMAVRGVCDEQGTGTHSMGTQVSHPLL